MSSRLFQEVSRLAQTTCLTKILRYFRLYSICVPRPFPRNQIVREYERKIVRLTYIYTYIICSIYNLNRVFLYRISTFLNCSPAKHQRPVARAKITRKIMSKSTRTPTTIPMMDPASKSTPANRRKKCLLLS